MHFLGRKNTRNIGKGPERRDAESAEKVQKAKTKAGPSKLG
jgi:hypothetical protein